MYVITNFLQYFVLFLVERNMQKLVWMRHIESRKVRQIDIIPFHRIIDLKVWIRQKFGISMHKGILVIFSGETLKNYEYFEVVGMYCKVCILI